MWKIVKSAVTGRGHISQNLPCQDKVFSLKAKGVQAAALADGAGSAVYSHFGAEIVAEETCRLLTECFEAFYNEDNVGKVGQELLHHLREKLELRAEELEGSMRDLASTLLFVAVAKDRYILGHLGDGVIGYMKNGDLKVASYPDNGEFANETTFVTSSDALQALRLMKGELKDIQGFVLMSDGTEAGLYDKRRKELAPVLRKIMGLMSMVSVADIQRMLQDSMEQVIRQKTKDDCSLVIVTADVKGFPGYRWLSRLEKMQLFNLPCLSARALKRAKVFDRILWFLQEEHSLQELASFLHLSPKIVRKKIAYLMNLNFVEKTGRGYRTIIILK